MSLADAVAAILFLGVTMYAIFGGADFGSGFWDLLAGGSRRGGAVRRLVDTAIGPVWEANHVWLIFVLVVFWTGFPDAFVAFATTMTIPLSLAAVGIVLRGAGFAYRKYAEDLGHARAYGAAFAVSSVVTPFFFGTAAGGVASGRVPATGTGDRWSSWLNPTSLLGGVLAVATCAFLAACLLAADAERLERADLSDWFRRRALVSGVVTGVVVMVGVIPLAVDAPTLFDRLTSRGLVLMFTSAFGGLSALLALRNGNVGQARVAAVVAVGSVVAGWGVAQYPFLLVDEVTVAEAAGAPATLWGLLVTFGVACVLVVPSLAYLYVLTQRSTLTDEAPERGATAEHTG